MSFLSLSLGEFLALFGAVSGLVVALYLLDRSKKRHVVATLRFWIAAEQPVEARRQRRLRQPWSLLLQLLSLALLLLALSELRWGGADSAARDHVLILDTSAWMGARSRQGILMDEARAAARAYVNAVASSDRVMVVRADALATPVTGFESDRQVVLNAIQQSHPSSAALNMDQALDFALQVQTLHARLGGEIVYAGAGRIRDPETGSAHTAPPNLRVLAVNSAVENCGLRKIGLRRSDSDADVWEIFVAVKNYGMSARSVALALQFSGTPLGARRLTLEPGAEQNESFQYRSRAAGWLEARLLTGNDAYPADDRALLEVPAQGSLKVAVYSDQPESLRPVLRANPRVEAIFYPVSKYREANEGQIVILDRYAPPDPPEKNSIWIEPPPKRSPVTVTQSDARNAKLTRWRSDHPLGMGLRTKDLQLESTEIFRPVAGDIAIAEVEGGAVILARPGQPKLAVLGFQPLRSNMRFELATPLIFANILRWMAPEIFRVWDLNAGTVGTVTVPLDPEADPAAAKVVTEGGKPMPYTVQGHTLRFFAANPGTVRILSGDRELIYSLTLPEVAGASWKIPSGARRGIPRSSRSVPITHDLWQLLAILGGLGLLAEWLLFGRSGIISLSGFRKRSTPAPVRKAS